MGLTEHKINNSDFNSKDISSLSDRPNADGMSATALKERFDAGAKKIVTPKFNALIDELTSTSGATGIGATGISGLAGYTVQAILESIKNVLDTKKPEEEADRELEQKFDKKEAQALVKTIDFDEKTGIFTITKYDGTVKQIDTAIEKVALDVKLEGQQFVLTLADGTKQRVDLSAFLTETETKDSSTISIEIANGVMSAQIKTGSIKNKHLSNEVTEYIDSKEQSAKASADAAAVFMTDAKLYATDAEECQTQACQCASAAAAHELSAENSANNAKTSEENAAESAEKAQKALNSLNVIPIEKGGTGATTSKEALENLGGLPLDGSVAMNSVFTINQGYGVTTELSAWLKTSGFSRIRQDGSRLELLLSEEDWVKYAPLFRIRNASGEPTSYYLFGEHNYPEPMANAGFHNSVYRGKFLGTSVSDTQWSAISSGSFNDMFIGDYWAIDGVNWRIAAFDYYLNCGDKICTTHHAVIVPDACLYYAQMHNTSSGSYESGATANTTAGGYADSDMYTTNLERAKTTIKNAFSGHVLKHRIYLTNAVTNGRPSAVAWFDSEVDLMCEEMVYGTGIFRPTSDGTNVPTNHRVEKSQLPLFAHEPSRICNSNIWWLRDVVSAYYFAFVGSDGLASCSNASHPFGVRPAFCIS